MIRLAFLSLLVGAALCTPVEGQTLGKIYRVGVLSQASLSFRAVRSVVIPELAKFGFVEGGNLMVDLRAGNEDVLTRAAHEIMDQPPDAILAIGTSAIRVARRTTSTIPIIIFGGQDAVAEGLVESISHPGGNITGVVILSTALDAKRLELLHEAVPAARRIAILLYSHSPIRTEEERQLRVAAVNSGVDILIFEAAGPDEYPTVFAAMRAASAQALVIGANASFFAETEKLTALALEAQLPTACQWAVMAEQGCLIGYGPNRTNLYQVAAGQLARVLQGVLPERIPIEQPALFELALNLQTARTLGLDLPLSIIVQADKVVE
jgi:putative ABC transport system substrate-binding protein